MTQNVLLHAGGRDNTRVQIEQSLAVGEKERSGGAHLPPNEHVLRRQ